MSVPPQRRSPPRASIRWANLPLRWKGIVVVAIPVVALTVATGAFFVAVRMGGEAAAAQEDAVEARAAVRDMVMTVLEAEADVRGFLLTEEDAFNPYETAAQELELELEQLTRVLEDDPEQDGRLALVHDLTEHLLDLLGQFGGQDPPELRDYLLLRGEDTSDGLRGVLEAMVEQEDEDVAEATRRADQAGRVSRIVVAVTLPLGLLGGLGAVILFTSSVVRRVQLLETNAARLGSRRPLQALPEGEDEVGRLGVALRNAHEELEARALALERTNAELQQLQAELRRQALRDELTDLYNRRGFVTLAEHQLRVAARVGHQACVLFVDLDGMKRINDVHGHSEGDRALVETAELLRQTLRKSDLVARLGGDEFCAVLVDSSDESENAVLERLENAIETRNGRGDLPYRLALSVGSARFDPRAPRTIDELLDEADRAMYLQKTARLSS
jgi:diguanylate cyclase (GGDEF)-like protein